MTDDFLDTLRRLDDDEYPGRGDRLDPVLVVRAGRHRRATRRIAGASTACVVVVALAVGVPAALGQVDRTTTTPIGTHTGATPGAGQRARGVGGEDPIAELEPGLEAVQSIASQPTGGLTAVTDVDNGVEVVVRQPVSQGDDRVSVEVTYGGRSVTAYLDLDDGGSRASYGAGNEPKLVEDSLGGGRPLELLVGTVPSWQRDPSAYLYSPVGWTVPDGNGRIAHAAEIPTFHPPADGGRLMYAVVVFGDAYQRLHGTPLTQAFVGSDGDAFWPECGRWTGAGTTNEQGTCDTLLGVPDDRLALDPHVTFDLRVRRSSAPPTGGPSSGAAVPPLPSPLPADAAPLPGYVLAPGVTAATRLPAAAYATVGEAPKTSDWWYDLGDADGVTLALHVGAADDGQVFALYGTRAGETSASPAGTDEARFDAASPIATTQLDSAAGGALALLQAGVTPTGTTRAFLVSTSGFDDGQGTSQHALELPTFAPPVGVGPLAADQRLYAFALTGDAMGALLDGSVAVVFATADGTVVGSGVTASDVQKTWPQAYARIQAILSGAAPTPCAEFPATGSLPGDVEGWWNSSPADAQANILRDPGLWPAEPREHPRVALVDTDTATVISTYDRIACGPDPHFVPRAQAGWPPHSVAVVDIDTGKTIQILAAHDNG